MRIFISAGEPSGDLHGANLIHELRRHYADAEFVGFGGERMRAAGCRLLYPLTQLAVMWFARVLANLHVFLSLVSLADRFFAKHKVDAVVLIDFPGFNWWVARRARYRGVPVFYFVPPQVWAWCNYRVKKMRRDVDHVLCSLPFERDWYAQRGVAAHYVGHPYFDEMHRQRLDAAFLAEQRARPGRVVALLPGSRTQEVERNFDSMVRAARMIHSDRPDVRFLVACYKEPHRKLVADKLRAASLPVEAHVGRTPEVIAAAHCCIAVSGSVSLELLFHGKPTAVVYRIGKLDLAVARRFITSKYITLVNLLADRELFPEFLVDHCPAPALAGCVLDWLNQPHVYRERCHDLAELRRQVARPGACGRAADFVAATLGHATPADRLAA